jgi:hypothetical protein
VAAGELKGKRQKATAVTVTISLPANVFVVQRGEERREEEKRGEERCAAEQLLWCMDGQL